MAFTNTLTVTIWTPLASYSADHDLGELLSEYVSSWNDGCGQAPLFNHTPMADDGQFTTCNKHCVSDIC